MTCKGRYPEPTKWKSNIRKQKLANGQEYVSKSKKVVPAKVIKKCCAASCPKKCITKIPQALREQINAAYWNGGDITTKRHFIVGRVLERTIKERRPRSGSRQKGRTKSLQFTFEVGGRFNFFKPVNSLKKQDLIKLLRWVPLPYHQFYLNIEPSDETSDYPTEERENPETSS